MKFILSRTHDYKVHSKKWIAGYGLLFCLASRIFSMILIIGCIAIYKSFGIDPETITQFAGNPDTVKKFCSTLYSLLTVCIVTPLIEECIFRLGLSFRRWQIALAFASIPLYLLWQRMNHLTLGVASKYALCVIAAFAAVYYGSTDSFWKEQKQKFHKLTIWSSSIAYGLIYLLDFSSYSWMLIPYMLCVISIPFFGGCAITYYRINLGFWYGVGLHIFNNLNAIMILMSIWHHQCFYHATKL